MQPQSHTFLFVFLFFCSTLAQAQYPQYFSYDNNNKLPSNEVYSLTKDEKGFLWLGCDAGLYKFNGVSYLPYKCRSQKSRSVSGLTHSTSGKLYCFNFQSQLFYVDNDSLKELPHSLSKISNISCDLSGHLLVNHQEGFAVYDEDKQQWQNYSGFGLDISHTWKYYTKSVRVNSKNEAYFLNTAGLGVYKKNKVESIGTNLFIKEGIGNLLLECVNDKVWIFSVNKNIAYTCNGDSLKEYKSQNLFNALAGKKITNIKHLGDGNLWIFTYSGLVFYDTKQDSTFIYYPHFSFSDGLIDREGNYWFSTLQSGVIRVADLQFSVWNNFENKRLTKISESDTYIFFSTVNGTLGRLHKLSKQLKLFDTGSNADIQSLNYDPQENCLYFFTNANLYVLKDEEIRLIVKSAPPTKWLENISGSYFLCSSFGTYLYDLKKGKELKKLNSFWSRKAEHDKKNECAWISTNEGLLKYKKLNNTWYHHSTLFSGIQIISSHADGDSGQIFVLTFDGKIYSCLSEGKQFLLKTLPEEVQAYAIKYFKGTIYLATNKGLLYFNTGDKDIRQINLQSGLTSENIQDLSIKNDHIFLATSQGLQKIPLPGAASPKACVIYLKNNYLQNLSVQLKYREPLILYPEVNAFSSNGKHKYAYRLKNTNDEWMELPGSIEAINIQNIPSGDFEIELKAIDYFGRNSENIILLKGHVKPPYWRTWWFLLIISGFLFLSTVLFFKRRISSLKLKQQREIERMILENELRFSQQSAIKAQMKPHFIFNVLNSIKGYIYENDKKNATLYLNRFSELIRKILQQSSVADIKLEEEIEFLKVYIELEAMLLDDAFTYEIHVDEKIHTHGLTIPNLLIQPFVENAFKHGLNTKAGNKSLYISFHLDHLANLKIEILDNGVGRSSVAKENFLKSHTSFASEAVAKRIHLLNHGNPEMVGLEVIDLVDDENKTLGTKVILRITTKK